MNFWQKLKKKNKGRPILVLAPMADVTDRAFRQIIAKYGKPDVLWTEFVSADGLFLGGYDSLKNDLAFSKKEKPIVAQFFTSKPEMMEKAAALAVKLGFDGVDINMGCPDKSVEKQGAGAGLMKNPELAKEIILAAKRGAGKIPVSVKTRIGYNKNELETWLPKLLEAEPAVITIHARTRKEMSLVPARWKHIKRAVEIRNAFVNDKGEKSQTLIFGNGDVFNLEDALQKAKETGCDGVMVGRGIFGRPEFFANLSHAKRGRQIEHPSSILLLNKKNKIFEPQNVYKKTSQCLNKTERSECDVENRCCKIGEGSDFFDTKKKLKVLVEHTKLFEKLVMPKSPKGPYFAKATKGGQGKSFAVMKKHFKAYVNGFGGAKELRTKLMECKNAKEVEKTIKDYLKNMSI